MLAAAHCVVVTACLVWCFGLNLGNLLTSAVLVDGNENQIGAGHVKKRAGLRMFDPDFDADFEEVLKARLTLDLRMSRSPTWTGWMKSM